MKILGRYVFNLKKIGIIILPFLLSTCSGSDKGELKRYINEVKLMPPKPIEPFPEFKRITSFQYPENDHRRSPFKPKTAGQTDTFVPNVKRPKQPLESFSLDTLIFVGILEESTTKWALVKDPKGTVTRIKVGEYMGQNYGEVIRINHQSMLLSETVQLNGKWKKRRITINLSMPT